METIWKCPLGRKCEWIEDEKICKCTWYVKLIGKNPQSEEHIDDWRCAIAWMPILLIENAQTNRGQTQALESFRNEVVKEQRAFNFILDKSVKKRIE